MSGKTKTLLTFAQKKTAKKEHSAKLLLTRVFRDWRTAKKNIPGDFFYARVNFVTADFS